MVKNPPVSASRRKRHGFDSWVGKIPWRRARQLTPVFLLGESPWTKEPGRVQFIGLQKVTHDKHFSKQASNHFLMTPLLNTFTLGIRILHMNFAGTQTFSS